MELSETFEVDEVAGHATEALVPRWNIAPTDSIAAIITRGASDPTQGRGTLTRKLVPLRWGLVPSWSRDTSGRARLINARSETVATKPSFRKAFSHRRCLLPADGYYEWYTRSVPGSGKPVKQPFWIHPLQRVGEPDLMVMAGIYEYWRNPERAGDDPDAWYVSAAIITTATTDALGHIHDRMPMQVRRRDWSDWLDPGINDPNDAQTMMHVPGPDEMTARAVSRRVNSVRNDGPDLIDEIKHE